MNGYTLNMGQGLQVHAQRSQADAHQNMDAIELQNRAVVLMQSGQALRAKPLAQRSIEIRERVAGEHSLLAATAYLTMGQIETELGNYEEALRLCKKSAEIRESFPGNEHDAACARDDAARCLEGLGMLQEAREYRKGGPSGKKGLICGSTPCSKFAASYKKYETCGQCRCVWYCSRACQKQDWKRHKQFCKPQPVAA